MSFVTGLAVRDLLQPFTGVAVTLKWPNDILIDGKKAAGILVESGSRPGGLWLAVGIGVNLQSAPSEALYPAAALSTYAASVPAPEDALVLLAEALRTGMEGWLAEGFEPVRKAWLESAAGLDQACTVRLDSRAVEGVAQGLDADGALLLRLASGELERITAGDVFFGESAR